MAEWKYLPMPRAVVVDDLEWKLTYIASDVAPEHGSTIAMVPRMVKVLKAVTHIFAISGCMPGCDCFICLSHEILREIRPATEPGGARP